MKKFLVLALVLCMALSVSAFAALPIGLELAPTPEDYAATDLSEHKTVNLYDNSSVVCFYCLTDRQCISGHEHIVEGNISFAVSCSSFDQCHCDLRQLIIKKLFSIHFYIFYQRIINGDSVDTRSLFTRIHEDVQTNLGKCARKTSCLGTDRMGNTSQRQIIRFKTIFQHQLLRTQHRTKVTADQTVNRTLSDIAFRTAVFIPDAKSGTGNHRQVTWRMHPLISAVKRLVKLDRIFYTYK